MFWASNLTLGSKCQPQLLLQTAWIINNKEQCHSKEASEAYN